jgi:hypothetical protein
VKVTLSAKCNMLKTSWRHSGKNSTCPCLWQVSLSFFVIGRRCQHQIRTHELFNSHHPDRIGPLGAPCGCTHGWGRRNGPLGSLGSISFSLSCVGRIDRVSCISCLAFLFYVKLWQSEFESTYYYCMCPMSMPQNPVPNYYPTDSHTW